MISDPRSLFCDLQGHPTQVIFMTLMRHFWFENKVFSNMFEAI